MAKFTSASVSDININASFGNICPYFFFFLDFERGEPPKQSQPLIPQGIHCLFFKNTMTLADILLEITTFE